MSTYVIVLLVLLYILIGISIAAKQILRDSKTQNINENDDIFTISVLIIFCVFIWPIILFIFFMSNTYSLFEARKIINKENEPTKYGH